MHNIPLGWLLMPDSVLILQIIDVVFMCIKEEVVIEEPL